MAKNHLIKQIGFNGETFSENGNGLYISNRNPDDKRHLMDFFGTGGAFIEKVVRKLDNIEFSLGQRIGAEGHTNVTISRIFFKNKEIIFQCGTRQYPIEDIHPFLLITTTIIQTAPAMTADIFKEIEEKILKERPIRLSNLFKKNVPATLEEFLIKFFTVYNEEDGKDTIYVDDKSLQTENGRRRSIGDLYLICRYYFPSCTLKEVANLLILVLPKKLTDGYRSSACGEIKKQTFYYIKGSDSEVFNVDKKAEYGYTYNEYKRALKS